MRVRLTRIVWLAMVGGMLISGGVARAQFPRFSPFESRRPELALPSELPFEYVGFIQTSEGLQFRFRNRAQRSAEFLKLNERATVLDVIPRRYDPEGETLTVEHLGRTLTLPTPTAKVRSSPTVPAVRRHPPAPWPSAFPVPRAVTDAVKLNPTPADEINRLKAVAAEIERRRNEREKAASAR